MSHPLVRQPIEWINSVDQLEEYCLSWKSKKLLAIDTEFMRSQTYYPIAGLIQVNDGCENTLIDPTTIHDLSALKELLANPNIIKSLHSCSEDLEVFKHLFGELPKSILDTQVAAAMVGYRHSLGYSNLAKTVLDIDLPKEETRSDWLQRPLSQSQIHYAAMDVEYLSDITYILLNKLKNADRLSWAMEECVNIANAVLNNCNPENSYLRNKTAWKLNARQLAVLKLLSRWREKMAQKRDVPRNRVVKEHTLFEMAQSMPKHIDQLRNFQGLTDRMIRTDGNTFINLIQEGREIESHHLPDVLPRPIGGENKNLAKDIRAIAEEISESENIAPEVIIRKKEIEFILNSSNTESRKYILPDSMQGWRKNIIGDAILEFLGHNQSN